VEEITYSGWVDARLAHAGRSSASGRICFMCPTDAMAGVVASTLELSCGSALLELRKRKWMKIKMWNGAYLVVVRRSKKRHYKCGR
jgi:hypothetical protein